MESVVAGSVSALRPASSSLHCKQPTCTRGALHLPLPSCRWCAETSPAVRPLCPLLGCSGETPGRETFVQPFPPSRANEGHPGESLASRQADGCPLKAPSQRSSAHNTGIPGPHSNRVCTLHSGLVIASHLAGKITAVSTPARLHVLGTSG